MTHENQIIQHDGREWRVLSTGVTREDGFTMAHLASTTQIVTRAKNGNVPRQICDWVNFNGVGE